MHHQLKNLASGIKILETIEGLLREHGIDPSNATEDLSVTEDQFLYEHSASKGATHIFWNLLFGADDSDFHASFNLYFTYEDGQEDCYIGMYCTDPESWNVELHTFWDGLKEEEQPAFKRARRFMNKVSEFADVPSPQITTHINLDVPFDRGVMIIEQMITYFKGSRALPTRS